MGMDLSQAAIAANGPGNEPGFSLLSLLIAGAAIFSLFLTVLAAPALAGCVYIDTTGSLLYRDTMGDANKVSLERQRNAVLVEDRSTDLAATDGCTSLSPTLAKCSLKGVTDIEVSLGEGVDSFEDKTGGNVPSLAVYGLEDEAKSAEFDEPAATATSPAKADKPSAASRVASLSFLAGATVRALISFERIAASPAALSPLTVVAHPATDERSSAFVAYSNTAETIQQ